MRVLNVGGGPRGIKLPSCYDDYDVVWLDIQPECEPDLAMDARALGTLKAGQYDAVYSSHMLEHFYPHEVGVVLRGMLHVLKENGFAEIRVPDVMAAMRAAVNSKRDIDAFLYHSLAGPVTARDVLWGYPAYTEAFGDAMAHRTGFSARTLRLALFDAGFEEVYIIAKGFEIRALACKATFAADRLAKLGVVDCEEGR